LDFQGCPWTSQKTGETLRGPPGTSQKFGDFSRARGLLQKTPRGFPEAAEDFSDPQNFTRATGDF
jgi:hypothetical protein